MSYYHCNLILRKHPTGIGIWNLKLGCWHTLPTQQTVVWAHRNLTRVRIALSDYKQETFNQETNKLIRKSKRFKW